MFKKTHTKLAAMSIGVAAAGLVLGVLVASAQTAPSSFSASISATSPITSASTMPGMSITFDRNGNGFIEGMVTAVGTNSFTLSSWGGPWTIDVGSSTQVIEHYGHPALLSDFQVGDYVRVDGSVASDTPWTVVASVVRDVTLQYALGTFHGTINAVSGNSFTFQSVERGLIMVNVASTTSIDVNGISSTMSALTDNMTGMVFGNWDRANTNLTAVTVQVNGATATSTPI
jgi:hypothetical protein